MTAGEGKDCATDALAADGVSDTSEEGIDADFPSPAGVGVDLIGAEGAGACPGVGVGLEAASDGFRCVTVASPGIPA